MILCYFVILCYFSVLFYIFVRLGFLFRFGCNFPRFLIDKVHYSMTIIIQIINLIINQISKLISCTGTFS